MSILWNSNKTKVLGEKMKAQYKTRIEENDTSLTATARKGNWLWGYRETHCRITHFKDPQKDSYDSPRRLQIEYDTLLVCEDTIGIPGRTRHYWYLDGKFTGISAGEMGISMFGGKTLGHLGTRPPEEWVIRQNIETIKAVEDRVSRTLIERTEGVK